MLKMRIVQKNFPVIYPHLSTSANRVCVDYVKTAIKPFVRPHLHDKNQERSA